MHILFNSSNSIPLDNTIVMPIRIDVREDNLCGHPNSLLILKLFSDMRFGACLGYDGPRMSKFSKNLKSSIDNPTIIESTFCQFPVHPDYWELLGIYWNKSIILTKVCVVCHIFSINFWMHLSGFYSTSVL